MHDHVDLYRSTSASLVMDTYMDPLIDMNIYMPLQPYGDMYTRPAQTVLWLFVKL